MGKNGLYSIGILIVAMVCVLVIYLKKVNCSDNLGTELNAKRRQLGIPIIPSSWKIKKRESDFVWWMGKELVVGHESKRIVVLSGCSIDEEIDDYFFSLSKVQEKTVQIRYKYANAKRLKDSISYTYQVGNYARAITRKEADSLFTVAGIEKDY